MKVDFRISPLLGLKAVLMGIGELIPGVGAQTTAILLGVYDDIIEAGFQITNFGISVIQFLLRKKTFKEIKKEFFALPIMWNIFLWTIALGTFAILTKVIAYALAHYPMQVFGVAFGIVIATVPLIYLEIKKKGIIEFVIFAVTLGVLSFVFMQDQSVLGSNINPFVMVLAGLICSFAALLPGISVSFAMILLGIYGYFINTIQHMIGLKASASEVVNFVSYFTGFLVGTVFLIKLLKVVLEKYASYFYAFVLGVMVASIPTVWPFLDVNSSNDPEKMTKILPTGLSPLTIVSVIVITLFTIVAISAVRWYAQKKEEQSS